MNRVAFIGAGNMAEALARGVLRSGVCEAEDVTAADPSEDRRDYFARDLNIRAVKDNAVAVVGADVVVLAVKPQVVRVVLQELAGRIPPKALVLSIAAGIPTALIEQLLHGSVRVARAMPNLPALVARGATAICPGARATPEDMDLIERLLAPESIVVRVTEDQMDAVTAVSGTGPAYVFYLMEAMLEAASEFGLEMEVARKLVAATCAGAAKMASETRMDPAEMRRRVTTPNGTTAAAMRSFEEARVRDVLVAGIRAACARSRELSGG